MSTCTDLANNPAARRYLKTATVLAEFANNSGVVQTLEGAVPYVTGDALLTGIDGERWPVARAKFDAMYEPAPDQPGHWRKRNNTLVYAMQRAEAFTVDNQDGKAILVGQPGDWLVEYSHGDQAVVADAIFRKTYTLVP